MPPWAIHLFWIAAALEGVCSLVITLLWRRLHESTRILDWGPRPNRILRVTMGVVVLLATFWFAFEMRAALSWPASAGAAIFICCMGLNSVLGAWSHLGLFESDMYVSTRFLFGTTSSFIEWSKIKQYQWTEQGTLIVNPGWNQTTCLVPDDAIADVDAVLKAKCLDAEVKIQQ